MFLKKSDVLLALKAYEDKNKGGTELNKAPLKVEKNYFEGCYFVRLGTGQKADTSVRNLTCPQSDIKGRVRDVPSRVIHLVVAEEYLRKHTEIEENHEEFIKGVLYPDSVLDKSETHYGIKSSKTNLADFLQEHEIENSFTRGYFLHLVTDYLFYNRCLKYYSKEKMYRDYDILDILLPFKYNVRLPEELKGSNCAEGDFKLSILTMSQIENFIKTVSDMDIAIIEKEVKKNPEKWTSFRLLQRI